MKISGYFTKFEKILWMVSVIAVAMAFLLFDRANWLSLIASIIGVTFLIFNAKGNPLGQLLTVVFGVMYGIISYSFSYYGEMITYLGMTTPMAILALISWLRHPYKGQKSQVEVNSVSGKEILLIVVLTGVVTVGFYFILSALGTANIIPSTASVTTSFIAVYLTFRRSPYYALAYASNDLVLIIMWFLATVKDRSYISVLVCFAVFLVNDLYGFVNWTKMKRQQKEAEIIIQESK